MFELEITISGLCLVIVQGERGRSPAVGARVLIPYVEDHRPQLVFQRPDQRLPTDVKVHRYFGSSGQDLFSYSLKDFEGSIEARTSQSGLDMNWAKDNRPVPIAAMDWLIDAKDVELHPRNCCGITCSIGLPPGRICSKNIVLDYDDGKVSLWKYAHSNRIHALADDILIRTEVESKYVTLKKSGQELFHFAPRLSPKLELCIANDDVVASAYGAPSDNPHQELQHIAKAVGQDSPLDVPTKADDLRTDGFTCPQIVLFDPDIDIKSPRPWS